MNVNRACQADFYGLFVTSAGTIRVSAKWSNQTNQMAKVSALYLEHTLRSILELVSDLLQCIFDPSDLAPTPLPMLLPKCQAAYPSINLNIS